MKLENQVAVVTGAGRGIGRAIALRFAAEGAKVAVISRTEKNAEDTSREINDVHEGMAKAYPVDVGDFDRVTEVAGRILAEFGQVDILVNNAGVTRDGLSMRMPVEDWDAVMDTNLKGAFNFIRALERPMIKRKSGRIINISSVIGLIGNPGQANYAASKAGLIGLTKSVAREVATRGITVNAVAPGFITTDMTESLSDEIRQQILKQIPVGKFGEPGHVADLVAFLAGPEGEYITGQVITVDGGMVM